MGKWCLHASSFSFDRIIIKVAGNKDRHKRWASSILGLWFPWPIHMFFEMRCDLGTLDSDERPFPFGLLVFKLAGNEDRHKIWDDLEFRPDLTTPYRVRCP